MAILPSTIRGRVAFAHSLREGGTTLRPSGFCWCEMFTAFMFSITLTHDANVLITMASAPLMTALTSRAFVGHRLAVRTSAAIGFAGIGIVWMYAHEFSAADPRHLLGTAVAAAAHHRKRLDRLAGS